MAQEDPACAPRLRRQRVDGLGRAARAPREDARFLGLAGYEGPGRGRAHLQCLRRRRDGDHAAWGDLLGAQVRHAPGSLRHAVDGQLREGRLTPSSSTSWRTHMAYVDGFIVPVPKKSLAAYRSMARKAGKIWREHGALEFKECVADDVKMGKWTSFPRSVKRKPNETVVFSYIVYKSRKDRDRINAKVMRDPRLAKMMDVKAMPFDAKRMIYGGFKVLVDA